MDVWDFVYVCVCVHMEPTFIYLVPFTVYSLQRSLQPPPHYSLDSVQRLYTYFIYTVITSCWRLYSGCIDSHANYCTNKQNCNLLSIFYEHLYDKC